MKLGNNNNEAPSKCYALNARFMTIFSFNFAVLYKIPIDSEKKGIKMSKIEWCYIIEQSDPLMVLLFRSFNRLY